MKVKAINIRIPEPLWRQWKVWLAQHGTTSQAVLLEAIKAAVETK